jgi:predicted MFS family arabinose efflux permease
MISLGYLGLSGLRLLWQLYVFYGVVVAAGMGGCLVPLLSTVSRWFTRQRSLVNGIVMSGMGVGTMLVPPVVSELVRHWGWRAAFLALAALAAAGMLPLALVLRHPKNESAASIHDPNEGNLGFTTPTRPASRAPRWPFCLPALGLVLVSWFCFGAFMQTALVHAIPHAIALGLEPTQAAGVLAMIGGVSILASVGTGLLAGRIGVLRVLWVCFASAALGFGVIVAVHDRWVVYPFAAAVALAYGGVPAQQSPFLVGLYGMRDHGGLLGILNFATTAGACVGTVSAGWLHDLTGSYTTAFGLCFVLSLLGLLLLAWTRGQDARKSHGTAQ